MCIPSITCPRYFMSCIASYVIFPPCLSKISFTSSRTLFWICSFIDNSYRQKLMVVEEVSKPAMKNTNACAAIWWMVKPSPFSSSFFRSMRSCIKSFLVTLFFSLYSTVSFTKLMKKSDSSFLWFLSLRGLAKAGKVNMITFLRALAGETYEHIC